MISSYAHAVDSAAQQAIQEQLRAAQHSAHHAAFYIIAIHTHVLCTVYSMYMIRAVNIATTRAMYSIASN